MSKRVRLKPGMAAYLYDGAVVGIAQVGRKPLTIIVSYPLSERTKPVVK